MPMLLLDTHVLFWWAEESAISAETHNRIEQARLAGYLFVSAASAWEIGILTGKRQYLLPRPAMQWWRLLFSDGGLKQIPIDGEIALQSWQMPGVIHGDPADRLITATAMLRNMTLLTRDRKLIQYCHEHQINVLPA
jgi:PIN domain nuclease of toxin-antitoxin system